MISIGDTLDGKYEIVRSLGRGAFGQVFLADDHQAQRQVAIKVLSANSIGDRQNLVREMQALAQFRVPGIVTFYHHFTDGNEVFLVMEFCEGGSLDDRILNQGRCNESEVFDWAIRLCETLASVHDKGIVHHDIKPQNILFTDGDEIKVGDFGIANSNFGTRIYMPPEMFFADYLTKTDTRVDIYSLGIALLEALTGKNPFENMTAPEQLPAQVAHDFIDRKLPRWIQEVLLRATHPKLELRFQTMRDFAEALKAKKVPYVFEGNRIMAHALAEKAELFLSRRKWHLVRKKLNQALQLSPDCVAALLAAGRYHLMTQQIDKAKEYFTKASTLSPRTHVQKELGWIHLEEGQLPIAISLLTDHLQRSSSDFEAYNLLLKCFFLSGQYEAANELSTVLMKEKVANDCFRSNQILCRLLDEGTKAVDVDLHSESNPFVLHNLNVATETPPAWSTQGKPTLKSKLIFEEYRCGQLLKAHDSNLLEGEWDDGTNGKFNRPFFSVGSNKGNTRVLDHPSVSRRHAVLINLPDYVWVYDLGSTLGVTVDGRKVKDRMFLDGVHEIKFGSVSLRLAVKAGLLV